MNTTTLAGRSVSLQMDTLKRATFIRAGLGTWTSLDPAGLPGRLLVPVGEGALPGLCVSWFAYGWGGFPVILTSYPGISGETLTEHLLGLEHLSLDFGRATLCEDTGSRALTGAMVTLPPP